MLIGFGYDALFVELPTEVNARTETNKLYERMEAPKLLTDDQDIRDTELSMYVGGNGDYYIELKETKRGEVVKLDTRIAMSGGNATPEIRHAVSNLFKALLGQKVETGENNALLPDVSNTEGKVCVDCGKVLTRSEANGGNCCDICWLSN